MTLAEVVINFSTMILTIDARSHDYEATDEAAEEIMRRQDALQEDDRAADHAAELLENERRLMLFAALFDADPEGVASIFVGLTLACALEGGRARAVDIVSCCPGEIDEARISHVLATAPFVDVEWAQDGDDESGPDGDPWGEFKLLPDEHYELGMKGAQRWIEEKLARVRPTPPPVGVSSAEIVSAVAAQPFATVEQIVAGLEGHGPAPRPVHVPTVAAAMIEAGRAREAKLHRELAEATARVQRYHDQARALAAGLEES